MVPLPRATKWSGYRHPFPVRLMAYGPWVALTVLISLFDRTGLTM